MDFWVSHQRSETQEEENVTIKELEIKTENLFENKDNEEKILQIIVQSQSVLWTGGSMLNYFVFKKRNLQVWITVLA